MALNLEGYLPAGTYSTQDTLAVMARYAVQDAPHPKIQALARKIAGRLEDARSIMLATRNWILSHMIYVLDPGEAKRLFNLGPEHFENGELEMVRSPLATLEEMRYDCDCIATFIAAILINLEIPVRFTAVAFHPENLTGPDGFSHVFAQGWDGSDWFTIDPVSFPHESSMLSDIRQVTTLEVQ